MCASDYTGGDDRTCYSCSGLLVKVAEVAAIITWLLLACLLFCAYKYLTVAGDGEAQSQERSILVQRLYCAKAVVPFQAIKILIVAWQIVTEVRHAKRLTLDDVPGRRLARVE